MRNRGLFNIIFPVSYKYNNKSWEYQQSTLCLKTILFQMNKYITFNTMSQETFMVLAAIKIY